MFSFFFLVGSSCFETDWDQEHNVKKSKREICFRFRNRPIADRTHNFDLRNRSPPHYHRRSSHFWRKLSVRRHQSFWHCYYRCVRCSMVWRPLGRNALHNYSDRRALLRNASNSRDTHFYRFYCGADWIAGHSVWPAIDHSHRPRSHSSFAGQPSDFYSWPTTNAHSLRVSMIWNAFSTTTASFAHSSEPAPNNSQNVNVTHNLCVWFTVIKMSTEFRKNQIKPWNVYPFALCLLEHWGGGTRRVWSITE